MKNEGNTWRKNFELRRADYQMPYIILIEQYRSQIPLLGRAYLKEGVFVFENMDLIGAYFPKDQLRALINVLLQKIIDDPAQIDALHHKTIVLNRRYFALARRIEQLDHGRLSDKELIGWYEKIMELQRTSHGLSQPTTWFLDSDGEDFSKYLLNYAAGQIKKVKAKDNPATAFSLLTTPRKDSFARIEEKEFLKLIAAIQRDPRAAKLFTRGPLERTKERFAELPSVIQKKILRHFKQWRWTPYTYIGPAYELDYYLELIAGLIRQGVKPLQKLKEYHSVYHKTIIKQRALFKKLRIDPHMQHLFRIAQDIIWIKGFRKDCLYYGCYVRDMLLKEVARRLGLSIMQARYLIPEEVSGALLRKRYAPNDLNERMKFSVIYMRKGKNTVLVRSAAKKFLAQQKFERIKRVVTKELKGTCACPGKVKGIVKIVNFPEEMGKMKQGDIMLAHTTFPALVPAMKKAAAIVTEDGGITCHAAIVSRELKTPCIVGIKTITQVFKDGDKVEVDAEKGIVRKL